jgi:cytochrome c biogenesis protein CcmG/thiol:disulfide interchange protein DsbE
LPPVDRLHAELGGRGLRVVLVNFRESPAHVRRVVRERGYRAPVLLDERGEVTGTRYGVFGPPTVYVLDRDGRLLARGVGPRDWSSPAARRLLEALLAPGGQRP